PENNPYTINNINMREFDREYLQNGFDRHYQRVTGSTENIFLVEFDDVSLFIKVDSMYPEKYTIKKPLHVPEKYRVSLFIKAPDEDNLDEIKCSNKIGIEIFKIVDKILKDEEGKE